MSNDDQNNAQIMRTLGELTGAVRAMNEGLTARLNDVREDIRRYEAAQNERMKELSARVSSLEAEDKKIIAQVAKIGVGSGGISGALTAGLIELIKHLAR